VYAVIAILLGTVTMTAPLALLGTEAGSLNFLVQGGLDNESAYQENRNLLDNSSFDINQSGGTYSPPTGSYNISTEPSSDPTQIGLLVIPSFLVALAFFVLFKKKF
jgi:hypothetical protein